MFAHKSHMLTCNDRDSNSVVTTFTNISINTYSQRQRQLTGELYIMMVGLSAFIPTKGLNLFPASDSNI